jgi:hypothetical protein
MFDTQLIASIAALGSILETRNQNKQQDELPKFQFNRNSGQSKHPLVANPDRPTKVVANQAPVPEKCTENC